MQKQRPHDLCQTVHFFKSGVIKNVLGTSLFVEQIFKAKKNLPRKVCDTGDRGRTDTPSLERDFESRASANSATPA